MKPPLRPGSLVGARAVAEILGVTRQALDNPPFVESLPRPLDVVGRQPIWRRADIERFAAERAK